MAPIENSYILKLSCPDRPGIVHAVAGFLVERGGNILDSAQFNDRFTGGFFMRVHFQQLPGQSDLVALQRDFAPLAVQYEMQWELVDAADQAARDAHGLEDRSLPERPVVPLQDGPAQHRNPGHRLEPQGFLPTGRELQHSVPLPAAHERNARIEGGAGSEGV